jgi:hypothetical protein
MLVSVNPTAVKGMLYVTPGRMYRYDLRRDLCEPN